MLADTVWWWKFWKLLHITGVFGFLAAHGATAAVALQLRKERDPVRVRALLDVSRSTRRFMYLSLALLLVAGISNGFVLQAWGRGWIWTALVLLVALLGLAFPLAVPYYKRIRLAVAPDGPGLAQDELAELLASSRPIVIAAVETAGILVIAWLMIWKPF